LVYNLRKGEMFSTKFIFCKNACWSCMASLKFLILITVFIVLLDINLEHEIEFMHNLTDTLSCIQIYQQQHNKQMSCPAMGQLLSNTLYYKRFFPYYSFNVLGGLDSEGKLPQALNVIFKPFLFIDAPFFFFLGLIPKLQERVASSHMMLLVPMRELDIVPKVLVPHSSCPFWITS
jgi:hypothetical protein